MKFKKFNAATVETVVRKKASIRFSRCSGLVNISSGAVSLLNLTHDSRIEFLQNEEQPGNWYIHITPSQSGFKLTQRVGVKSMFINRSAIVDALLKSRNFEGTSCSYLVSRVPDIVDKNVLWSISREPLNPR